MQHRDLWTFACRARWSPVVMTVTTENPILAVTFQSLAQSTAVFVAGMRMQLVGCRCSCTESAEDRDFGHSHASDSYSIAELGGHQWCVNGAVWAPHSAAHICTVWRRLAGPHLGPLEPPEGCGGPHPRPGHKVPGTRRPRSAALLDF
jgi:hypothetical protein